MTQLTDIVVPASIGNLGAGFDALSVALQLYLRVTVLEVDAAAPDAIATQFAGDAPAGTNGIERAFELARARAGVRAPGVRIHVRTDIPIRAGLGSSAAAAVAGLRLYHALTGALDDDAMLALAGELEGHPDNAAACLLGGVVASCRLDDGRVIARPAPWPERLRIVVATPDVPLETKKARGVLPASVPLADAVFNLQRALLLVRALEQERFADLREAFRDRWHQPARAALVPGLKEALALEHPAVLGVCLSGSGPSIAAFALAGREREAAAALAGLYERLRLAHSIRILHAHQPSGAGAAPVNAERENTA